jgi:rRNA processing protein Krr1/Pno1
VTLKAIREATETEIQLPDRDPAKPAQGKVTVTISGTPEGCKAAKAAIVDLCTKGFCKITDPDTQESSMQIPHSMIHALIGKQGCVIRAIQDSVGARLNMPDDSKAPAKELPQGMVRKVKVGIVGSRESVQAAKDIVNEILKFYHHPLTHPGIVHAEIPVEGHQFSWIIGPGGATIKHLKGNYKCEINVPRGESINDNVVVVGEPAQVEACKKAIYKLLEEPVYEETEWKEEAVEEKKPEKMAALQKGDKPRVYGDQWGDEDNHEEWMDEFAPPPRATTGWGPAN